MKRVVTLTLLLAAWAILASAQTTTSNDKDRDRDDAVRSSQTNNSADADRDRDRDRDRDANEANKGNSSASMITNGPGADKVTDSSAEIFWNTSVPSTAVVRYGTSPKDLDQNASESTSGQTSHKVELTNLKPNTKYYFQVDAGQGQGTGTEAKSGVGTFTTK
jgi:hypothetical protein